MYTAVSEVSPPNFELRRKALLPSAVTHEYLLTPGDRLHNVDSKLLDEPRKFSVPVERIYLLPATLYKIRPAFDAFLAKLLLSDRGGALLMLRGQHSSHSVQLEARLRREIRIQAARSRFDQHSLTEPETKSIQESEHARDLPDTLPTDIEVQARLIFLKKAVLSRPEFLALLKAADVVLDPWPFGGGLTSLESFSVGTPVVTMQMEARNAVLKHGDIAPQMRSGRLTRSMYVTMQMCPGPLCCVASSPDEYVAMAIRIAHPTAMRREVRASLQRRAPSLFSDEAQDLVVREWVRFLRRAVMSHMSMTQVLEERTT
jgi:hypothetical protein